MGECERKLRATESSHESRVREVENECDARVRKVESEYEERMRDVKRESEERLRSVQKEYERRLDYFNGQSPSNPVVVEEPRQYRPKDDAQVGVQRRGLQPSPGPSESSLCFFWG